MKTIEQIRAAGDKLCETLKTPGLNRAQLALFAGMLNALAWVRDSPNGSTLDRLLAGETVAAGKDPSPALETLSALQAADAERGKK